MFIDINTLGPEGLAFDRVVHLRGLDGPSRERLDDVEAHVSGSVVPAGSGEADLSAHLEAPVSLQCSRCLERFSWVARSDFELTVVRRAPAADEAEPEREDDAERVLVAPEGKVQLEDMAIEQLYLQFPLKPICSPECRGLCPSCGANRNVDPCDCPAEPVDPRLAPLLDLRPRKNQES